MPGGVTPGAFAAGPAAARARPPDHVIGVDFGQRQDYTACAVLERSWGRDDGHPGREVAHFAVRYLRRWPLHTS
jgi:hypothetical protein